MLVVSTAHSFNDNMPTVVRPPVHSPSIGEQPTTVVKRVVRRVLVVII